MCSELLANKQDKEDLLIALVQEIFQRQIFGFVLHVRLLVLYSWSD